MPQLTYTYQSQQQSSMNLLQFRLMRSWQAPDHTTTGSPMALMTDTRANNCAHILHPRLLHRLSRSRQDDSKRMKTGLHRYKGDHDRKVCSAQLSLTSGQYDYIDLSPLMTSTLRDCSLSGDTNRRPLSWAHLQLQQYCQAG